jgi:SOS-response transcriptional repressor LexA
MKNSRRLATNSARKMPMAVSMIAAGSASEVVADYHLVDLNDLITRGREGFLAFEVTGDSMVPDIRPGYVVFVDSWADVRNGDVVAAETNGLTSIKIFQRQQNSLFLVPTNGDYRTHEITAKDEFRVLGVVKGHLAIYR